MEQAPADVRAAPVAAGLANMDTTESLSPKNPRESASGKKVSQRATQNHPGPEEPENQSSAHEAACQRTTSTSQSLAHHATLMGGRLKSEVDRAPPWVDHLVHSTIFKPAVRQITGSISCQTITSRSGQVPTRCYTRAAFQTLIKTHKILTLQSKARVTPGSTQNGRQASKQQLLEQRVRT
jgi:hypothetical protein